jgi:hypothetical protein
MANFDSTCFSSWDDIPDDSKFVYEAMAALGFLCEFSQLSVGQMQMALGLAEHLKRAQSAVGTWES